MKKNNGYTYCLEFWIHNLSLIEQVKYRTSKLRWHGTVVLDSEMIGVTGSIQEVFALFTKNDIHPST